MIAINQETSGVFWFESQMEASRQLEVLQGNIGYVLRGERNKTHDCWFCNADSTAVEKTRAKFGDKIAEKVEKLIHEHL